MGIYLKKTFWFSLLSPQTEKKQDDEHFANHIQIYVSRAFTKAQKSVLCAKIHSELKTPFI